MMKQLALFLMTLLLAATATAQVDREEFERQRQQMRAEFEREKNQMRKQYDEERRKAEEEFAAFRQKANEEYAAAMRSGWQQMGMEPAIPKPKEPTPPRLPSPPLDKVPSTNPLPQGAVAPPPVRLEPVPLPAIPEAEPLSPTMQFSFYGVTCDVHTNVESLQFRLSSLDEKSIGEAWKQLSQKKYDGLLHDCIEQRDAMRLSDWGYIRLLGSMSEQLLGKGSNEAVLLQMYLLAQSGYNVRIARRDNSLTLLMPFNQVVYSYSYIDIDGTKYYMLAPKGQGGVYVCKVAFPRERVANILMAQLPDFGGRQKKSRTLHGEKTGIAATVQVQQRLIDYFADYPLSDAWQYYALAGLSDGVKATLYPEMKKMIAGKSLLDAANMLLDFVQSAFDYATDQEQFGYERPLFADESIYYPQNDCEDRSIFYSILVRDLLGLDVVLVHWPGHLATAVAFPESVDGDYFTLDGRRYTVCDPTYIGATVGMTMPQFQNVSAKLVKM